MEIQWEVIPRYLSFSWDPILVMLAPAGGPRSGKGPSRRLYRKTCSWCFASTDPSTSGSAWPGSATFGETVNLFREMDWDDLLTRTAALGSERMLLLGLSLAYTVFCTQNVPTRLLDKARADPAVERLAEDARRRLLAEPGETRGGPRT